MASSFFGAHTTMPIYAYRCEDCGHAQDFLQKISDPLIDTCPQCGSKNFRKQLTAAGFQLKGGGWYVTDFRDSGKKDGKKPDGAPAADKPADKADGGKSGDSATPAATPAAAPAASSTPASTPAPAKSAGSKSD